MPLDKDKSCPLLLDKSNWKGTFGKCIVMIVKMLPSTLDMLFMISLCLYGVYSPFWTRGDGGLRKEILKFDSATATAL